MSNISVRICLEKVLKTFSYKLKHYKIEQIFIPIIEFEILLFQIILYNWFLIKNLNTLVLKFWTILLRIIQYPTLKQLTCPATKRDFEKWNTLSLFVKKKKKR